MDEDVIYQYAVKVIYGTIPEPPSKQHYIIGPGIYFTSVNVHNPWRHQVTYAIKLAVAGYNGAPGPIENFTLHQLGPDAVTEYDALGLQPPPPPPPPPIIPPQHSFEGYCVIECEEELDVVGVYTGAAVQDQRLGAMHLERVPARTLPRCRSITNADISSGVAKWMITQSSDLTHLPLSQPLLGIYVPVMPTPLPAGYANPSGSAVWLGASTATGGDCGGLPCTYTYELDFCLCWTFRNAQITLNLWADNKATLSLNGNLLATTPTPKAFTPGNVTSVTITTGFVIGINKLQVVVTNTDGPSPTGMLIEGSGSADAADCYS